MSKFNLKSLCKKIFKWIAIVFFSLVLITSLVIGYLWLFPDGFTARQKEGPKVLTDLLRMAEESTPFNPDPYISSTYQPDNPLYQPVLEIQRHRWDIAEKLLEPLVEKGNAGAMFWLAEITYGSPYRSSKAAHLYQKSAKLGNPYAALRLDVDNPVCQRFMSGFCKEKWGIFGRKLLKERADKGDVKAGYYLLRDKLLTTEEEHKELERLVTENAKNNYYYPLMDMLDGYLNNKKLRAHENKKLVIQLMKLAVNNNYVPLMSKIVFGDDISVTPDYLLQIIQRSVYLEDMPEICSFYYSKKEHSQRSDLIKGGACALTSDHANSNRFNHFDLFQFRLKQRGVSELSKSEITQAKKLSDKMIERQTPSIYIDEMNPPSP
ncbi:hypothetical protein [Vibrio quintilis]|uniref:Sel1 repeat protein n=1 Tax=Vibrio quintilis TaxID=1117707 RepID=A0A1M7YTV2_9VIBR|nr:hypothetical protein [Vibrio quintilis]SHO56043.1 hypothetical protein VQ7734_01806 [Vibrio quintilis]